MGKPQDSWIKFLKVNLEEVVVTMEKGRQHLGSLESEKVEEISLQNWSSSSTDGYI